MTVNRARPNNRDLILDFVRDFRQQHQVSPSIREIGSGVGISSTSVVVHHVNRLVAEGWLMRAVNGGASRNLVPVETTADSRQQTADGRQQMADSRQQTGVEMAGSWEGES